MKSIKSINLLLVSVSLERKGGVAQYVKNLLNGFKNKNVKTDHFTQKTSLFNLLSFIFTLKRGEYDAIHINPSLGFRALLRDFTYSFFSDILGYKTVFFIHGWDEKTYETIYQSFIYSNLFVGLINRQDAIIVLDTDYQKKLVDMGCHENKIHVSSTMVDTKKYLSKKNGSNDEISIVFCSRIEKEKGIFLLLDSLEKLPEEIFERVKLTYIGTGSDFKKLKKMITNKNLNDKVQLKGYVSEKEKIRTYHEGDIFVFPTFHGEGFPTVILEAMAAGLPIITTDIGGTKRAVVEGVNGYYLSSIPPSSDDIADKIFKVLNSDMEKMSINNVKKVSKLFDSDVVMDQLIDVYRDIAPPFKMLLVGPSSPTGGVGGMLLSEYGQLKNVRSHETYLFDISSLKENPINLIKLLKKIVYVDLTHIHCSFSNIYSSFQMSLPLVICKFTKTKNIVTYHTGEPIPYFERNKDFLNILFSLTDLITVPSNKQKDVFLRFGIAKDRRIKVLYNFIKPYYIRKSRDIDKIKKKNCVITTGEVSKYNITRKGFVDFKKLSSDLPDVDFYLIGKIKDRCGHQLKESKPSNLFMKGFVDEKKLADYYSLCKVYLQLSRSESFGVSMVEAMAFGCVPIIYDRGALPEVIDKEGFIVNYKDLNTVKERIIQIIEGKHDKNPRKVVMERYTPMVYLEKLKEIVNEEIY